MPRARRAPPAEDLPSALARPEPYPHRPDRVEARETHISWVFLAGDRAYKLKKPVVLDAVDYGTPRRRRDMCREEVRLNSRLAPDLYLGVRGVARTTDGYALTTDDADPEAVDFVVEMRRYDERHTLASRLRAGELKASDVAAVARRLARFHAEAQTVPASAHPVLAVERRFEQGVHELMASVDQRAEVDRILALERFAHAFVAAHARELHARARRGCVREGHGDLRAEHVLLDGEVQVVDGVEFDRELRELDVADDLAFLVCDLAALGGERFAKLLVAEYRSAGGDPGPDSLLAFYAAYRALVRAKVALLQAAQAPPRSAAHGRASKTGRDLIVTAERFAWRARLPLAIAVCGRPASGKSNVARALAETSGLPHLSSDETRKRLAQIRPAERGAAEIYAADWNARTYRELGRRAAAAITQTGGAIVDATFRHRTDRESFRSAFAARAPVLFVECLAPAAVLAKRAAVRASDPARVSDADPQVVQDLLGDWDALDEVGPDEHLALRTDRPQEEVVGDVIALLDQRLLRLAT